MSLSSWAPTLGMKWGCGDPRGRDVFRDAVVRVGVRRSDGGVKSSGRGPASFRIRLGLIVPWRVWRTPFSNSGTLRGRGTTAGLRGFLEALGESRDRRTTRFDFRGVDGDAGDAGAPP